MPIYEYQCESCGDRFERLQKISDPPLETCDECGGPVRKLISAPAFQFKGSGWYVTDYARKGQGGGKSDSGDGKSGDTSSSSASSTSKDASQTSDGGAKETKKKAAAT